MEKGRIIATIHENKKIVELDCCVKGCYIHINDMRLNDNISQFFKCCGVYYIPADTRELKPEDRSLKFTSLLEIADFLNRLKQISLSSNSEYFEKWI